MPPLSASSCLKLHPLDLGLALLIAGAVVKLRGLDACMVGELAGGFHVAARFHVERKARAPERVIADVRPAGTRAYQARSS